MRKSIHVGTYTDDFAKHRVTVEIEVSRHNDREHETVEHETINSFRRLSISGTETWQSRNGRWMEGSWGQIVNELRKVTSFAKGWNAVKRDQLVAMWDRWHLNDMQAGCSHMKAAPTGTQGFDFTIGALDSPEPVKRWDGSMSEPTLSHYTVNRALVCPVTGYRYGRSWLTEDLPQDVLDFMAELDVEIPA